MEGRKEREPEQKQQDVTLVHTMGNPAGGGDNNNDEEARAREDGRGGRGGSEDLRGSPT